MCFSETIRLLNYDRNINSAFDRVNRTPKLCVVTINTLKFVCQQHVDGFVDNYTLRIMRHLNQEILKHTFSSVLNNFEK